MHFLIADDFADVRQELWQLFASQPTWRVVAEAADGQEAMRLAAIHRPDVALVDVIMPGLDGIQAAWRTKAASPATCIIVYTAYHNGAFFRRCLFLKRRTGLPSPRNADGTMADGYRPGAR